MPQAARDKIASTEVVMPVRQSEIYVFVPMETAGQAHGLIGAIVDAAVDSIRTSKAEAAVKPLRNSLVDFNFDETFQNEMKTSLGGVTWLGADGGRITKEISVENLESAIASSKANAVLMLHTDYRLSNDGNVLTVQVHANFYPVNEALRALLPPNPKGDAPKYKFDVKNTLYRNVLIYEETAAPAKDRDAYIATWSADHGAKMRASLKTASTVLAKMLSEDIQRAEDPANKEVLDQGTAMAEFGRGADVTTDENGTLTRFPDGTLKFVGNPKS